MAQGSRPYYSYGGQLTFPIGNTGARATYKKGKLAMEQYLLTLKKLEQTIIITIDNDIVQAQSSYQQVAATRGGPRGRRPRPWPPSRRGWKTARAPPTPSCKCSVISPRRAAMNIQALAAYNNTLAQLSLDEGTTLQRLGINVEVK